MEKSTAQESYTIRLLNIERVWWRKFLDPQIPYRWFLRRLQPGFMLEVGCGVGRNLLNNGGRGVGLDHNPTSVSVARSRGLNAMTPHEFQQSKFNSDEKYDSLLFSHVLEHMRYEEALDLVSQHLRFLKKGGNLILICPQWAGFLSDKTHVEYFDLRLMSKIAENLGLTIVHSSSFPFPAAIGKFFTHNEWVVVARK